MADVELFRCVECHGSCVMCKHCTVRAHVNAPLHWIERWTGTHWHHKRLDLCDLGLRIQLLHPAGEVCERGYQDVDEHFTVIHTNGIHRVHVAFCGCGRNNGTHLDRATQLLYSRWWPATAKLPRTAATFAVLDNFHRMNTISSVSHYKFYKSLEIATDATGTEVLPSHAWNVMTRAWSCVMMFKRRGAAHLEDGLDKVPDGSLTIVCPACPHLGKNTS
ncbi:hypothetical protein K488DRAFT_65843 [Vararia minispora EC-137]|uniref:Uncharacterized protein n=1 Tax=Vararia minispora EC-137 TaxID=1314806 RepID=A0ACB8Q4M6_9AGAM|nr:hypothetical protein K488DRAFT_65843 [Vararia minispora EC-137]